MTPLCWAQLSGFLIIACLSLILNAIPDQDVYNSMGSTSLVEDVRALRKKYPGKLILFTDMRYDGAGAEILPMLASAAYARKRGWIYGGAIRGPPEGNVNHDDPHGQDVVKIAEFIFNRHIAYAHSEGAALINKMNISVATVKYQVVSSAVPCIEQECRIIRSLEDINAPWLVDVLWMREGNLHEVAAYLLPKVSFPPMYRRMHNGEVVKVPVVRMLLDYVATTAFLEEARAAVRYKEEDLLFTEKAKRTRGPAVVLHVRRGKDVDPDTKYAFMNSVLQRYTEDDYYYNLVDLIRKVHPNAEVHVFSSLEGAASDKEFQGYRDRGMTVHFEEIGVQQTWTNMMQADIFIMAKSSFSFVAGLLSSKCVIFDEQSFDKRILASWVASRSVTEDYIKSCFMPSSS